MNSSQWPRLSGTSRLQTISKFWNDSVPDYTSQVHGALLVSLLWDPDYADDIASISSKRAKNRCDNYLIPEEIERVHAKLKTKDEASIRFGNLKSGHGYSGERGDFCLVGGLVKSRQLTLFYRSLELIGGFAYDLCLINKLEKDLGCTFGSITIFAARAFVFALKGNSNQKLYPKLKEIFRE